MRIFHDREDFEEETLTNWTWKQDGLIRETIIQSLRSERAPFMLLYHTRWVETTGNQAAAAQRPRDRCTLPNVNELRISPHRDAIM